MKIENWLVKYILRFLPPAISNRARYLKHYFGDLKYGIDSAKDVGYIELAFDRTTGSPYTPGTWWDLNATVGNDISTKDVFIDFGSGKGRMVFMAAHQYPFRKVIGVEICERLNVIARRNIRKNMPRLKCKNVELITANVLDYNVPDDVTVVYMFNPFAGDVFAEVVDKLRTSLKLQPRQLRLIYRLPVMHELLLQNGFHVKKKLQDVTLYVAGTA